ncbi:NAD(+) diphosphatase [Yinghuangia sp. ASG 101]|uniref:NAD(+) diphosphatase n=1 Tax=Yinghuangia sp. ASG 101 TaxID=2896848 RepID=UPI001E64E468|nr:NAD(+) diphosphatase [Yinghuangia sp. ASG 101]UGQ14393.1 NAD(+) diphosphatase [Yinghuangia sp. ASG 101]
MSVDVRDPRLAMTRATHDRAAEHRVDEGWLATAWDSAEARVLVIARGKVHWTDPGADGTSPALTLVAPADAPDGERYFLGVDPAGTAHFAVAAEALPEDVDAQVGTLYTLGPVLGDRDAGLLVHAVGLENWHRTHTFCARCGKPTRPVSGGHVRRCTECAAEHFPRTDPAVIMLVVDRRDRALLGRQASWPEKRFSTLAGFVEPGESLRQAVAREVAEETGVRVAEVTYVDSQPWPFPSSLMLGFHATASDDRIQVDGTEIAEARWFTRDELRAAVAAGEIRLPGRISISRHLIELWFGERFPDSVTW